MDTCPKCGTARAEESPAFSLTKRIWFGCGSYSYAEEPEKLGYGSDICNERAEKNGMQRELVEIRKMHERDLRRLAELEVKLDNLQASTIHSCGDNCQRPACAMRRERDEAKAQEIIHHDNCLSAKECLERWRDLAEELVAVLLSEPTPSREMNRVIAKFNKLKGED